MYLGAAFACDKPMTYLRDAEVRDIQVVECHVNEHDLTLFALRSFTSPHRPFILDARVLETKPHHATIVRRVLCAP